MAEYTLRKAMLMEAETTVEARDGTDAARQLMEWRPMRWTMSEHGSSSRPVEREPREKLPCPVCGVTTWGFDSLRRNCVGCGRIIYPYSIRGCRGHWHVTLVNEDGSEGDDISVEGDPFKTKEDALAAMDRENRGWVAPTPFLVQGSTTLGEQPSSPETK